MTLLYALLRSTCGSLLCAWLVAHYAILAERGDTQASARYVVLCWCGLSYFWAGLAWVTAMVTV